jgi:hypothetical protein
MVTASMFAPAPTSPPLRLERCMRVLPTHDDVGGFFCAVIVKHATDRQVCTAYSDEKVANRDIS